MGYLYSDASTFNQPLNDWGVFNVTNMRFIRVNLPLFSITEGWGRPNAAITPWGGFGANDLVIREIMAATLFAKLPGTISG